MVQQCKCKQLILLFIFGDKNFQFIEIDFELTYTLNPAIFFYLSIPNIQKPYRIVKRKVVILRNETIYI